ncbi:MAG: hypothetical protein ACE14T_05825 [Syntrophales bacterium]
MVRAIDIQQVLIQSNSMERVQQAQQQHPDLQQRYLDVQLKEEKKLSRESVKDMKETEHARVQEKKEENERKRSAAEHQEKGKDSASRAESEDSDDEHGGIIDIRV